MRSLAAWLGCGIITGSIAFLGVAFGCAFCASGNPRPFAESMLRMDGQNYRTIAEKGYSYKAGSPSLVAFFPAYPLTARWVSQVSRTSATVSLLVVSNGCCLLGFILLGLYVRHSRWPQLRERDRTSEVIGYTILAFGTLPLTFFFRMAYSESMFLCASILSFYGMSRAWPSFVVALLVGLATAVRPVGIALLVPFVWHIWNRSSSPVQAVRSLVLLLPVACWGILAFMLLQWIQFGSPVAFAATQKYHRMRPVGGIGEELLALLSWEPVRDVYNPASSGYWQLMDSVPYPIFSLAFMNPIYLGLTALAIILGAWRKWLTKSEVLFAIPLLVIPYITRAYEMRMMSQARFAAVVFPAYIVVGELLSRLPVAVAIALLMLSGALMGFYASLFATGMHSFF